MTASEFHDGEVGTVAWRAAAGVYTTSAGCGVRAGESGLLDRERLGGTIVQMRARAADGAAGPDASA